MEAEAEAGAEINWAEGAKKTIVTALRYLRYFTPPSVKGHVLIFILTHK